MEPQDPTENPFAPEYPHLQEWVTDAEAQLQRLNQEMERTGVAPKLELRPPDPMGATSAIQLRRSRADIQHDKDEKKATVYKRVEKETEKAEPNLKKKMQDIAFGRLYKEEINRFIAADRGLASPTANWSMNDVQVKVMAFAKASRDKQRTSQNLVQERSERTVIVLPAPAEATLPAASADAALPASAEPKQLESPADISQGASQEPDAPQEPNMEPEP